MPKTVNGYISVVVAAAAAGMTAYLGLLTAAPPVWAVVANASIAAAALAFKGAGLGGGK